MFAALSTCLFAFAPGDALAADKVSAPFAPAGDKWTGWWEFGGTYGTDDASRGEVTLFTPVVQGEASMVFLDFRGKFFEESVEEGNFAIGYREMLGGWNVGVWLGYDIRSTETDNTFEQVSGGFEALGDGWDFRVNGYAPLSDPVSSPELAEVFITGNQILMTGGQEVPLYGIDAEVGGRVFGNESTFGELWLFGGGFWFDDEDALEEISGPKARVEYRLNDVIASLPGSRLTIESEYSNDSVRDDKWEVGARLRIPFWSHHHEVRKRSYASLSPLDRRMVEGLERDTDIVTVASKAESVIDDETDVLFESVSEVNSATGLANAVGSDKLVIVKDPGADIDVSATSGQALPKNITVQGGGSTINVRGARTGTVAPFTADGGMPTLFSNDTTVGTGILTVGGNNTHIAGFGFSGVGDLSTFVSDNHAIFGGSGRSNVLIEDSQFMNLGGDVIIFNDNNSDIRIRNSTIDDVGADGVEFDTNNRDIKVTGMNISRTNNEGIEFGDSASLPDGGNDNVVIRNVKLDRIDNDAIEIQAAPGNLNTNFKLENIEISNVTNNDSGIEIGGTEARFSNITIRNVSGTPGGDAAIEVDTPGALSSITFDSIKVEGTVDGDILRVSGTGSSLNGAIDASGVTALGGSLCDGLNEFIGTVVITAPGGALNTFIDGVPCT